MDYEARLQEISNKVWELWTMSGRGLEENIIWQTKKSAQDAACNSYQFEHTNEQWIGAALVRLAHIKV